MQVKKRSGLLEDVSFDKITKRIDNLTFGLSKDYIDSTKIAKKVIEGIYDEISTEELDKLSSEIAAGLTVYHPDYSILAARIEVSNLHKNTLNSFEDNCNVLYAYINPKNGEHAPLISKDILDITKANSHKIQSAIDYSRDFEYDFFGIRTLMKSYLLKVNGVIHERPQQMLMRVSLGIHGHDIDRAIETYDLMSQKAFTHATPTLFNSGTNKPQLSSCFLTQIKDDSVEGIYDTLSDVAKISQSAGGIGLSIHNIRSSGSYIKGTNGVSNGIVPMLRNFDMTARYIDQCFESNTMVVTSLGMKAIESITKGDKVLTADGNWNTVNNTRTYEKDSNELLNIKTSSLPVQVTKSHPLLAIKVGKNSTPAVEIKRLESGLNKPEMIEGEFLSKGDYLGKVIPKGSHDILNLTEDDFRFYGILLGDGFICEKKHECRVYLGTKLKPNVIEFVKKYYNNLGIKYGEFEENNTTTIYTYLPSNPNFKFKRSDLYNSDKEKQINPNYLNISKPYSMSLLRGLIETDGSIKDDRIRFYTSSLPLAQGIEYLLLRLATPFYILQRDRIGQKSITKRGTIFTKKLSYDCEIPKTNEMCDYFGVSRCRGVKHIVYNNVLYVKIKYINNLPSGHKVITHDLSVDNNHTYTTSLSTNTNGGGRRKGSFAVYIEPWHADIMDFLQLKKNHGKEELRARDLFYALWICDLFMQRVEANETWSLFDPNECPGLDECYGEEFESLYIEYESEGKYKEQIPARDLWNEILATQTETGTPYMLYKDAANKKSNQKNLGTIKSSNLCTEIMEYTAPDEIAVCNLASISLPYFVKDGKFDFKGLRDITSVATYNLNKIIDINHYPVPEAKYSNQKHRPIGIGVQGLADVFAMLKIAFDSKEAKELNERIFENIYYASLLESSRIAKEEGIYDTFKGSPAYKGILQFDMWDIRGNLTLDWDLVRDNIKKHGLRNSLLVAPMPTASTSQILGNNECFEPFTNNLYVRRVLSGEFVVCNKHMVKDLIEMDLWDEKMLEDLKVNEGSIQDIQRIPRNIRDRYKTVWEISQKVIIDMAADRGRFICQSQSMNLFLTSPQPNKLSSMHFYAWKSGLKTGMYYLRTKAAAKPIQFTVEAQAKKDTEVQACSIDNPDCEACGS